MSYFKLIKAQCEVQDLSELLGQRLLPLQVLSGVVQSLAGQSSQEAMQRRLCEKTTISVSDVQCFRGKAQKHQGPDEGTEWRHFGLMCIILQVIRRCC